jgi:methylphosphotriester-DNA--protein-cysteine methyltransferase
VKPQGAAARKVSIPTTPRALMPLRLPTGPRHEVGGYREFAPPPGLAAAAESVWIHRSAGPGTHLVLPDPALNVAFRCRRLSSGTVEGPRLTVIGPKTRPYPFHFTAGEEIAAVKVKLEWARALLRLAPADHLDREDELAPEDVGLPVWVLDRLAAMPTAEAAAGALASALACTALAAAARAPAAPALALDLVRQATGRVSIESVADRLRISLRQLRRVVRGEAAISLKAYARITRLNAAMIAADRAPQPGWARVAAEAGFCDQSHLVRECRALAGLTPSRVHRQRRAEAETSNPR